MILFLAALLVLLSGALVTALAGRRSWANTAGPLFSVAGSALTLVGSLMTLVDGRWEWALSQTTGAFLSIHLAMDPLSAFFCAVTALITGVASVYGGGYLNGHAHGKNLGVSWAFFLVLSASMLLVETAWNGIFFLVAWEIMSLSSFFLVIFDGEKPEVLKAGWIYLVATHFATVGQTPRTPVGPDLGKKYQPKTVSFVIIPLLQIRWLSRLCFFQNLKQ